MDVALDSIEDAVAAFAKGEIVVVVDDEDRENEGDLILAAEFATPEKIAFFAKQASGLICLSMTGERLARQQSSMKFVVGLLAVIALIVAA